MGLLIVKARYVIGLTATPYRRDGQQPIILMQCGPVRHTISQKDRQTQELLRHCLICRDTSFTIPIQEGETSIHDIYAALAICGLRGYIGQDLDY
jgi:superfamily II DNA or RNA helicase